MPGGESAVVRDGRQSSKWKDGHQAPGSLLPSSTSRGSLRAPRRPTVAGDGDYRGSYPGRSRRGSGTGVGISTASANFGVERNGRGGRGTDEACSQRLPTVGARQSRGGQSLPRASSASLASSDTDFASDFVPALARSSLTPVGVLVSRAPRTSDTPQGTFQWFSRRRKHASHAPATFHEEASPRGESEGSGSEGEELPGSEESQPSTSDPSGVLMPPEGGPVAGDGPPELGAPPDGLPKFQRSSSSIDRHRSSLMR